MPQKRTNTYVYAAIAVAIVIAIAGLTFYAHVWGIGYSAPVVASGDTVQVLYTGSFPNGTVFSSNVGQQPLSFKVGAGQVISGFNNAVLGMKINQSKTVVLPPSEAYGQVNQSLIISVPRSEFGNQSVQLGMGVTSIHSSGAKMQGFIKSFNSTNVTIDFNPILAGYTLVFNIKVVSINSTA